MYKQKLARVDWELEKLITYINAQRGKAGLKRLTFGDLTSRMAKKYFANEVLLYEEFIRF
jgi:hypothetical protein